MGKLIVTTPVPDFSGVRAGVAFRDGRAEVDESDTAALAYFRDAGYAVGAAPVPSRRDLLARADALGLGLSPRATVAEITAAIAAHEGEPPDA